MKLRETIEKVNRYANQKNDPDLSRKPGHLVKFDIQNGPYFALKGLRAFFLTLGGVKVDTNMQALDCKDKIIPGLYVTGEDIGGLYDSTYDLLRRFCQQFCSQFRADCGKKHCSK